MSVGVGSESGHVEEIPEIHTPSLPAETPAIPFSLSRGRQPLPSPGDQPTNGALPFNITPQSYSNFILLKKKFLILKFINILKICTLH